MSRILQVCGLQGCAHTIENGPIMDIANKTHLLAISEAIVFYRYLDLVEVRKRLVSSKRE